MIDTQSIVNSIFYPRKSHLDKDDKDHIIEVEKNTYVGARFFLKDKQFDNIIYFHGNAELAQEYDDIAGMYHSYNLNFIVVDYRGYGLSNGSPNKDNLLTDSQISFNYVYNYLIENSFNGKRIIMGRSLGSASAFEITSKCSNKIDGCIIESGFATEYPLLELMGLNYREINFNLSDGFDNLKKNKNYKGPIFVIHAEKDHIVPLEQGELIYSSSISDNKKILVVESANHNNIIYCIKDKYFENIRDFIISI